MNAVARKPTKAPMKGIKALPKTDAELTAAFKADMKQANAPKKASKDELARAQYKGKDIEYLNPRFSIKCLEQRDEFMDWINGEFDKSDKEKRRMSDFFVSMRTKLICADEMSENMVAALRKCKDRNVQKPVEGTSPAVTVTLKIKKFLQGQLKLDSRLITGVVKQESRAAYLIEGHADMLKEQSWCMRCGQTLTQPASYTIGFGEICAEHLGMPYPSALNSLTGKQRNAYRKKILGVLHKQTFERWIPKSQIEEIIVPTKGGK